MLSFGIENMLLKCKNHIWICVLCLYWFTSI